MKKCLLILAALGAFASSNDLRADILDSIEDLEKIEKKKPKKEKPKTNNKDQESSKKPPADLGARGQVPEETPSSDDEKDQAPSFEPSNPKKSGPQVVVPAKKDAPRGEEAAKKRRDRARAPIRLKSQGKTTYSRNGGLIHLKKEVVITQEDLRMQSDEARIQLDESSPDNEVDQVEVLGNVKMNKFDDIPSERVTARGDRAYFYNQKQKVELIGNARLWKGGHLIRGKKITYDVLSGMITVDQAIGVVQPEESGP